MKNFTIEQFTRVKDSSEYEFIFSHLKPKNRTKYEIDFNRLTYFQVKQSIDLMTKGTTFNEMQELFEVVFGMPKKEFWKMRIVEVIHTQKHILEVFKELQERESKLLMSHDSDDGLWKQAGGDKLNPFSNVLPLVQIGETYGLYPYDLQNKPYNEIFLLLVIQARKNEVSKEFQRLKSLQK